MTAGLLLTFALVALPYGVDGDSAGQDRAAQMRFRGMDANNDGVITRDEWRGSPRSFERHDWNGDGRLAGNEVRAGAWQDSNIEEADHDPTWAERYVSWTDRGFASLDPNRDRRITPRGGRLYLGINDDHLPDNTGQFEVTIGIQGRRTSY